MAKNFKKITHNISYRHLGNDVYHAAFLFQQAVIAGRKKVWKAELWLFTFVGRSWYALFPSNVVVESSHVVRDRESRTLLYSGKDEVRAQLLRIAFRLRTDRDSLSGFELLWRRTIRGTTSQAGIEVKQVSTKLDEEPKREVFSRRTDDCTRCPDCGQTKCPEDCPGMS